MKWVRSRDKVRMESGAYRIRPVSGKWDAVWQPLNDGVIWREQLGRFVSCAEAKQKCEEHAQRLDKLS